MSTRVVVHGRSGRAVRAVPSGDPPPVVHDHPIHTFMVTPCVVHHSDPGTMDDYGDRPIATETSTDEVCYLWQSTRGETEEIEHERWQIAFKPNVALDANDSIDTRGMSLQVLGNPWVVIDPVTGWETHIEATVRRQI